MRTHPFRYTPSCKAQVQQRDHSMAVGRSQQIAPIYGPLQQPINSRCRRCRARTPAQQTQQQLIFSPFAPGQSGNLPVSPGRLGPIRQYAPLPFSTAGNVRNSRCKSSQMVQFRM